MKPKPTITEAIDKLLNNHHYKLGPMDYIACSSCGAKGSIDYEYPHRTKCEPCSEYCPWQILKEYRETL